MRKLFAIATVSVFVLTISSAYACGEKKSSAKPSKASYQKIEKVEMIESATADSRSEKAEVVTVDYSTAGKSACCPSKSKAAQTGVMKADAGAVDDKAVYTVTKDCPAPCEKDTKAENIKAENSDSKSDEPRTSVSTVTSVPE